MKANLARPWVCENGVTVRSADGKVVCVMGGSSCEMCKGFKLTPAICANCDGHGYTIHRCPR